MRVYDGCVHFQMGIREHRCHALQRGEHLGGVSHNGPLTAVSTDRRLIVLASKKHPWSRLHFLLSQSHSIVACKRTNLAKLGIVSRLGCTFELEVLD